MRELWSDGWHVAYEADAGLGEILDVVGQEVVHAVYTDPPWNAGIARRMRQWAGKDDGAVDFQGLMDQAASDLAWVLGGGAPGFVQMGDAGIDVTVRALEDAGLVAVPERCGQCSEAFVPFKTRAWLVRVARSAEELPACTWDEDDAWTTLCSKALAPVVPAGGTVLDPFVGLGLVLRVADAMGWRAVVSDLNTDRVLRGVKSMEMDRKGTPVEALRLWTSG